MMMAVGRQAPTGSNVVLPAQASSTLIVGETGVVAWERQTLAVPGGGAKKRTLAVVEIRNQRFGERSKKKPFGRKRVGV